MLRLMKVGRKRRKPAPNFFHPLAAPVGAKKGRSYCSCFFKKKKKKESNEDRCAVSFRILTHGMYSKLENDKC